MVTFELILPFGDGCSLQLSAFLSQVSEWIETYSLNDIVDQLFCLVDLLLGICHDQTMEIFFLVAGVSCVRSALSFLDGSFPTNGNLGA